MQPTLFLMVGLPGVGKTTAAQTIEAEQGALRLTKDEWMKALYGDENPSTASDVVEGRLVDIGLRALELGINVVIDFGLWGRDERTALRHAAIERGATVDMRYLHVSVTEQRRRLDQRHADAPHTTWPVSEQEQAGWAAVFQEPTSAELDDTEPLDRPPQGFSSWEAWRRERWPAHLAPR